MVVASVCGLACTAAITSRAAAAGGITVSPAMLNLNLPKDTEEQTASFMVSNNYAVPVNLAFTVERPLDDPIAAQDPAGMLTLSQNVVTVGARQSMTQTVTLRDSQAVRPGSQRAELVVSVAGIAGASVSVESNVRLPITITKESGAVSSLQLTGFGRSALRLTPPGSVAVTIANDGNIVAIPRGVVTVKDPSGKLIRQGVLNTASQAVSPEAKLVFATELTELGSAVWPGLYKVGVSYGFGGGQAAKTASYTYLYVAWWHTPTVIVLACIVFAGRRPLMGLWRHKKSAHPPPGGYRPAKRRHA